MIARRTEAGFTLVELLVGFILVGMLISMLFGGLRFGTRVWAEVDARSDQLEDVQPVRAFLRRSLSVEATMPPFIALPAPAHGVLSGTPNSITWRTNPPTPFAFRGLADMTAFHETADGSLILSWSPATAAADVAPEWSGRRVLLQGVQSLSIAYLDPDSGWRSDWTNPTRDPAAVRMEVGFTDPARTWPPLVIALPR